ncbi:hypothetical protein KZ483_04620 [Paenibacillus sp. sptzw28]|nr:hypothetical protein KZ483_04620 [Paenibacillus sp. sptzw28]
MMKKRFILYVSHDEDDGIWQFLEGATVAEEEARMITLKEIVELDPSLIELSDLTLGWIAWRESVNDQWHKVKK